MKLHKESRIKGIHIHNLRATWGNEASLEISSISQPHGVRTASLPVCIQSLYRLRYHYCYRCISLNTQIFRITSIFRWKSYVNRWSANTWRRLVCCVLWVRLGLLCQFLFCDPKFAPTCNTFWCNFLNTCAITRELTCFFF
jgi:hypothetical protein